MSEHDWQKRIEDKLDKQAEDLTHIKITLSENTHQLTEHIEGVKQTRVLIQLKEDKLDARIEPIEKHVAFINNIAKFLSVVLSLALAAKHFGLF